MKLIKQTALTFQEGKSDKIYEVDLCEVGNDKYVVNFRYGRRGANLKDGSKTALPVGLSEAEKIYNQLIASKTKKGYQLQDLFEEKTPEPLNIDIPTTSDPREQAIINRICHLPENNWPLERAIWRAGQLKINSLEPFLIHLYRSKDKLRDYCIIWALGLCGTSTQGQTIDFLKQVYHDPDSNEMVRRIAGEALIKRLDDSGRKAFYEEIISKLAPEIRESIIGKDDNLSLTVKNYLNSATYKSFNVIYQLYLIDNEMTRPVILDILRTAPLKPNYFKQIRHIFKAAEYRLDNEVYGLIAYRIEKSRALFANDSYYIELKPSDENNFPLSDNSGGTIGTDHDEANYDETDDYDEDYDDEDYDDEDDYERNWLEIEEVKEKLKQPDSQFAYGSYTRWYLRRRVWRTLKQLGEENNPHYVTMAVGILLCYSDEDSGVKKSVYHYNWNNNWSDYTMVETWYDVFYSYWAFNHILYLNSPRYVFKGRSLQCKKNYKPGDPEPTVREEAFPNLWDQNKSEVLKLLEHSKCRPVHAFGVKVLRSSQNFLDSLDTGAIIMLLKCPYETSAQLGYELFKKTYEPKNPDIDMIQAALDCIIEKARNKAFTWINKRRDFFLNNLPFILNLISSEMSDVRAFAQTLLGSSALSEDMSSELFNMLIQHISSPETTDTEKAKDMADIIIKMFNKPCRTLELSYIMNMLKHPLMEIQRLGGDILLIHDEYAKNPPIDIIELLTGSDFGSVRGLGVKLFGQLTDDEILKRQDLLYGFLTHKLEDIRIAIRPVLSRISLSRPMAGMKLVSELIDKLFVIKDEELHQFLVQVIKQDFNQVPNIPIEKIWKLLHSKSLAVQELGGIYLKTSTELDDLDMSQITKLADHQVRSIREASWDWCRKHLETVRGDLASSVRLLEVNWDDSRDFAFQLFRDHLSEEDYSPGILVGICDSVRPDVQSFGQTLITQYFKEENGQEYLLKMSEHPSSSLQLYATNYLERYASGDSDRINQLSPYFKRVLCGVNKGRIAKGRVFHFLEQEADKTIDSARIIADILTFVSATISVESRHRAIEIMTKIHKTYPDITMPLRAKEIEVRNAV
ncbi:MAG: WGR domain-containing protein [Spirochaetota bacterium]|nr:WGR domain-containing protein [Spirochaetota bacterium]